MKSYTIGEFMHRQKPNYKGLVVKATVATVAIVTIPEIAHASTGIDQGARVIYSKLLNIGKWVIIIKGALDTINNAVQGDFNGAKKSFLSYLLVYIVLHGLPWAMDEVDNLFGELS